MFDLEIYLKKRKDIIDSALEAEMPDEDVPPALLHKAMRYSVFSGGKRLRPILCLAVAEAVGGAIESAVCAASAIELLHTYTLVHDDLPCMDDDDLRRGKPTCHKVYGVANAVLVGDALQARAFEVVAKARVPSPYPPNQLIVELASAAGSCGVVGGQLEDIAASDGKPTTAKTIEFIHLHKTAVLFRAATRMGAIAGGAGDRDLEALTEYGVNLGLAFQIADDLLDVPNTDGATPKETTCLSVYGPDEARKKADKLARKSVEAIGGLDKTRTEPLIAVAKYVVERTH